MLQFFEFIFFKRISFNGSYDFQRASRLFIFFSTQFETTHGFMANKIYMAAVDMDKYNVIIKYEYVDKAQAQYYTISA